MDRNEYASGNVDTPGFFTGNGHVLQLTQAYYDQRTAGITFRWDPTQATYVNDTYGAFGDVTYTTSSGINDLTDLSLYAVPTQSFGDYDAIYPGVAACYNQNDFLGTATFVTQPQNSGTSSTTNATPDAIANVAQSFVGQTWNDNGCWVLASTIAPEAGSALPLTTSFSTSGVDNGPWFTAYDSTTGLNGDGRSMEQIRAQTRS